MALLARDDERLAARLKIMEAENRSALAKIHSDIHAQHGAALDGDGGFGGGGGGRAVREEGTQEERGHDHLQALEEKMQERMAAMQDRAADMLEEQLQAFDALLRKHGGSSQPTGLSPSHSQSVQPPAGPELANNVGDLIGELERKISGKFQQFENKLSSKLEVQMQQLEKKLEKKLGDEMQQVSPQPHAARESSEDAIRRLISTPQPVCPTWQVHRSLAKLNAKMRAQTGQVSDGLDLVGQAVSSLAVSGSNGQVRYLPPEGQVLAHRGMPACAKHTHTTGSTPRCNAYIFSLVIKSRPQHGPLVTGGGADTPPGQADEPAAASRTISGSWRSAEASAGRSRERGSERSVARGSSEESASTQRGRVEEYPGQRKSSSTRTHGNFIHTAEDRPVSGTVSLSDALVVSCVCACACV